MVLGWMLRLLLVVLIVRLVWRFLAGVVAGARRPSPGREPGIALVRDPVCGTFVEPSRALHARAGATTYYFCSERCQQSFSKP